MTSQRILLPRSVVALCLAVAAVLAAGPLASSAPANVRLSPAGPVTKPTTDAKPEFWLSAADDARYMAAWEAEHTTSPDSSAISVATSTDGGRTWILTTSSPIPQGQEIFLGDPRLAYDPLNDRMYFVMRSCFTPAHKCPPNVVYTDDFGTTFSAPHDIYTKIQTDNIEVATNPDIAVDGNGSNAASPASRGQSGSRDRAAFPRASSPHAGRLYVSWTDFNLQTPGSRLVIQSSDDGSATWTPPIQVSDPAYSYAENGRIEIAPNGDVLAEFMGYDPVARQYRIVVARSTDGGATWGPNRVVVNSIQSTGVLKSCGNRGTIAVLNGDLVSFPFPAFAVDPTNSNNLFVVYHAPAPKSNLPDVFFTRSIDGGLTWSTPVAIGSGPQDQWAPSIDVGPKGEIGVAYYSRQNDPGNLAMDLYMRFSLNHGASWGAPERVSGVSFVPPKLNPNYDANRRPCESPFASVVAFPGSGAYVVWVDTRDKGPAANNGVDPNIYFAHVPIPTTTSAAVSRAATTVSVAGAVSPPFPGSKVTGTLYRRVSGKFVKVTSKTATLNASSKYALSFTRTAAGSCQVIVKYAGNAEYLTSSVTKTFTC